MSVETKVKLRGYVPAKAVAEAIAKIDKSVDTEALVAGLTRDVWNASNIEKFKAMDGYAIEAVDGEFISVKGFMPFYDHDAEEKRSLFYFYDSVAGESDREDTDGKKIPSNVTCLDLGCHGNSVRIMLRLLVELGGGWLIENDARESVFKYYSPADADIALVKSMTKPFESIPSKQTVEAIRLAYPAGTRIQLTEAMQDKYNPIMAGEKATVTEIDDIGTMHVNWDNGSGLGIVLGADKFNVIYDEKSAGFAECVEAIEDALLEEPIPTGINLTVFDSKKLSAVKTKYSKNNELYTAAFKSVWSTLVLQFKKGADLFEAMFDISVGGDSISFMASGYKTLLAAKEDTIAQLTKKLSDSGYGNGEKPADVCVSVVYEVYHIIDGGGHKDESYEDSDEFSGTFSNGVFTLDN